MNRIAFIASGNGSILNYLYEQIELKSLPLQVSHLITDRNCGILEKAESWVNCYVKNLNLPLNTSSEAVSKKIFEELNKVGPPPDYIFLAYNRLIKGELLNKYENRIVNIHMSLLPAYQGFGGTEKAISNGNPFGGSTIHFVDESVDCGPIIIQSIIPLGPESSIESYSEKLFHNLCKDITQVASWVSEERIKVIGKKVTIENADYSGIETNPKRELFFL